MTSNSNAASDRPPVSATKRILRFVGSIRVGITLLVLILIYATIGSAVAPLRGILELSEMQVFQHWLFIALILGFTISLVTATLMRIRFNLINLGVWTVHTGLVTLVFGSFWYFWNKVEGTVLLISPRIQIVAADGRPLGVDFLADKGEVWSETFPGLGGEVRLEVLNAEDIGPEGLRQADVSVRIGERPEQIVTVAANSPKPASLGNGLALQLRTFPTQNEFLDSSQPALYYRPAGGGEYDMTPIDNLPLHRERYLETEGVLRDTMGREVPSKRTYPHADLGFAKLPTGWFEMWRMPIALETPNLPFDVRITGYVPYIARMEEAFSGGGATENPMVRVALSTGRQRVERTLVAFDPERRLIGAQIPVEFRWLAGGAPELNTLGGQLETLRQSAPAGRVIVTAGPNLAPTLVTIPPQGPPNIVPLRQDAAQRIPLANFPVDLTLLQFEQFARSSARPVLEARDRRRPNLGREPSAVRLEFTGRGPLEGWQESRWVRFVAYPDLTDRAKFGDLASPPAAVQTPDGASYELVFSRARRDLGTTLIPGKLAVDFFPGRQSVESWRSDFYVAGAEGQGPQHAAVYTNQTHTVGPWTLFQANASGDHWSWTGLGVGNRRGMWAMMLGSIMITAGCLYAFYVKPVLRRRRQERITARASAARADVEPAATPAPKPELVEVS